jgi:hypothetical protein
VRRSGVDPLLQPGGGPRWGAPTSPHDGVWVIAGPVRVHPPAGAAPRAHQHRERP